jgi:hypothetical protein
LNEDFLNESQHKMNQVMYLLTMVSSSTPTLRCTFAAARTTAVSTLLCLVACITELFELGQISTQMIFQTFLMLNAMPHLAYNTNTR